MMSEQVIEKLEEMTSEADTGYDTGSVVSASSLSQLNKVGIILGEVVVVNGQGLIDPQKGEERACKRVYS